MCFVLYIASPKPSPIIAWDEVTRGIHTEELTDRDMGVRNQFTFPHVRYIGSDKHCGCGFRNATFQNGCWPEEEWHPDEDTSHIEAQPNHERLIAFVKQHLGDQPSCEFYGIWEGDFSAPALSDQAIDLDRLADLEFYFRDRGHYTVTIDTKANKSALDNP